MSDIIFQGNSSIRSGGDFALAISQPRGLCPTHGEVDGGFHAFVTSTPDYRTPNLCPKCYIDWITAHVQAVRPTQGESNG